YQKQSGTGMRPSLLAGPQAGRDFAKGPEWRLACAKPQYCTKCTVSIQTVVFPGSPTSPPLSSTSIPGPSRSTSLRGRTRRRSGSSRTPAAQAAPAPTRPLVDEHEPGNREERETE